MRVAMQIKCPYCGHEREYEPHYNLNRTMITCCGHNGGCDRDYVISWKITHYIDVTIQKIEGEDGNCQNIDASANGLVYTGNVTKKE